MTTISAIAEPAGGSRRTSAMRSLEVWPAGHDELRGRVQPVVVAPQSGMMGSVAEVLMVPVGQGGATLEGTVAGK